MAKSLNQKETKEVTFLTLHKVYEYKDKEGQGGGRIIVGYFENIDDAKEVAKGKGIHNKDGDIEQANAIKTQEGEYILLDRKVDGYTSRREFISAKIKSSLNPTDWELIKGDIKF